MADVTLDLAAAIALQGTAGIFDTTLAGLVSPVDLDDGLIFGDHRAGVRRSGISYSLGSILSERAPVYGSGTQRDPSKLQTTLNGCTITVPMSGPKNTTTTPVDADFDLSQAGVYPALDALLRMAGFTGAARGGPVGWVYTFTGTEFASLKIWDSGSSVGVRDAHAGLTLTYTALEVPSAAFAIQGTIEESETSSSETFPASLDFQHQASIAAPGVAGISPNWGGATRHFTDLSFTIAPGIADATDTRGQRFKKGTARTVTVAGTMVVDSGALNVEIDNLKSTSKASENLFFVVGAAATGSDPALAHLINANNVRVQTADVVDVAEAGCRGIAITAITTADTAGGDFSITLL